MTGQSQNLSWLWSVKATAVVRPSLLTVSAHDLADAFSIGWATKYSITYVLLAVSTYLNLLDIGSRPTTSVCTTVNCIFGTSKSSLQVDRWVWIVGTCGTLVPTLLVVWTFPAARTFLRRVLPLPWGPCVWGCAWDCSLFVTVELLLQLFWLCLNLFLFQPRVVAILMLMWRDRGAYSNLPWPSVHHPSSTTLWWVKLV